MDDKAKTALARSISLGVGIFAIVISIVMAHSNIKSAYEFFNGFMGLVLGVLGGTFALGIFTKKGNKYGAYLWINLFFSRYDLYQVFFTI